MTLAARVGGGGSTDGPVSGRSAVKDKMAPTAIRVSSTTAATIAAAVGTATTRSAGLGGGSAVTSNASVRTGAAAANADSAGLGSGPGSGAVESALNHRVHASPFHQRNVLAFPAGSANHPESDTSHRIG